MALLWMLFSRVVMVTPLLASSLETSSPEDSSVKLTPSSVYIRGLSSEVARVVKEIEEVIEQAPTTRFSAATLPTSNSLLSTLTSSLVRVVPTSQDPWGVWCQDRCWQRVTVLSRVLRRTLTKLRSEFLNLGRRLADEVSLRVKVPNEYHATIIGTGGKFVKRLEEKYDVHIRFPRNNDSNEEKAVRERGVNPWSFSWCCKAQEEILDYFVRSTTATRRLSTFLLDLFQNYWP